MESYRIIQLEKIVVTIEYQGIKPVMFESSVVFDTSKRIEAPICTEICFTEPKGKKIRLNKKNPHFQKQQENYYFIVLHLFVLVR